MSFARTSALPTTLVVAVAVANITLAVGGVCDCAYLGKVLPIDFIMQYPSSEPGRWRELDAIHLYGSMCAAWDQMPGTPYYEEHCKDGVYDDTENWCQVPWCYVDPACPTAVASSVFQGSALAKYSYDACGGAPNCYLPTWEAGCPYDPAGDETYRGYKVSCPCKYEGQVLPDSVVYTSTEYKDNYGINHYGTTCAAWDQRPFTPWAYEYCDPSTSWCRQHGNWCQLPWCYVDADCPTRLPSTVFSGAAYYSYDTCGAPDCYTNSVAESTWSSLPSECPWDGSRMTPGSWSTSASCPKGYLSASAEDPEPPPVTPPPVSSYTGTDELTKGLYTTWHMIDVPHIKCSTQATPISNELEIYQGAYGQWSAQISGFNAQKGSTLAAVTFFRTNTNEVTIDFEMRDYENKEVLKRQQVKLSTATLRLRRMEGTTENFTDFDDHACENFWLSDGRSPVEIPDTWEDARRDFHEICTQQDEFNATGNCSHVERRCFDGYPQDSTPLHITEQTCLQLLEIVGRVRSRRTKGAPHSGSHISPDTPTMSNSQLGRKYGRGYLKTGYGYSGRGYSSGQNTHVAMYAGAAVAGGAVVGAAGMYAVGSGYGYGYSRHYARRRGGSTCQYADASDACVTNVQHEESMIRDDIVTATFAWESFKQPFTFKVYGVNGVNFEANRVCPPKDECRSCFEAGNDCSGCGWTDAPEQDIFVTFTNAQLLMSGCQEHGLAFAYSIMISVLAHALRS